MFPEKPPDSGSPSAVRTFQTDDPCFKPLDSAKFHNSGQAIRLDPCVGIDKDQNLAASDLTPSIARSGSTQLIMTHRFDAVSGCELCQQFPRSVCAGVVDNNHFHAALRELVCRTKDAFQRGADQPMFVPSRDDDGKRLVVHRGDLSRTNRSRLTFSPGQFKVSRARTLNPEL